MKPLGHILGRVAEELELFPPEINNLFDELRAQSAAAKWCLRHGLAIQGLTFLREAMVGVLETMDFQHSEADIALGLLTALAKNPEAEHTLAPRVKALRVNPPVKPELWLQFEKVIDPLTQLRNKFNHAYKGHSELRPISAGDLEKRAEGYCETLDLMIDSLSKKNGLGDKIETTLSL